MLVRCGRANRTSADAARRGGGERESEIASASSLLGSEETEEEATQVNAERNRSRRESRRAYGASDRARGHLIFWFGWGVLFLLALVLGSVGYYRYLHPSETGPGFSSLHHLLSSLYFSLQLFALNTGFNEEFLTRPLGWPLEAARWLAALVSAGTIAYALVGLFGKQISDYRLRHMRGHAVLCGLGDWSVELARELRAAREKVVIVEKDPADEWIPVCRARGIPIVVGDATDEMILSRVGIEGARSLVAFCSEDGTNASVAQAAGRALKGNKRKTPLPCHVHITDVSLREAFERERVLGGASGMTDVHLFSCFQAAARELVREAFSSSRMENLKSPSTVHLVVLGFSGMGAEVALQAARLGHFRPGVRLRITVVDLDETAVSAFRARYPAMGREDVAAFEFRKAGVESEDARAFLEKAAEEEGVVLFCAVCIGDDCRAVDAALRLPRVFRERRLPVHVWLRDADGIAALFSRSPEEGAVLPAHLSPFGLPRSCASRAALLGIDSDRVARAIQTDYRTERLRQELEKEGKTLPQEVTGPEPDLDVLERLIAEIPKLADDRAMRPSESLTEEFRNSNRQQADHMPIKLRTIGCYAAKAPESPNDGEARFTKEESEMLAEMEHRRWIAERRLAGWDYAPGKKNVDLKLSPSLLPWDELEEKIKDYDRNTVGRIPNYLTILGLKMFRSGGKSPAL